MLDLGFGSGRRRGRCGWRGSSGGCLKVAWRGVVGFRLRSLPICPLRHIRLNHSLPHPSTKHPKMVRSKKTNLQPWPFA